jgi:hypothetical protein
MSHMTQNREGDTSSQQAGASVHETSDDSVPTKTTHYMIICKSMQCAYTRINSYCVQ